MNILDNLDHLFLKAFESNPCPMAISEITTGKYILVNNAFLELLGYAKSEVIGKTSLSLGIIIDPNERREMILIITKQGNLRNYTCQVKGKHNTIFVGLFNADLIETPNDVLLLTVMNDITAKTQLEQEIIRLEKLNLIGQLAAGISHEVRNPMTTVKGFLQLFKKKPEYAHHKENFELMISELDRANAILSDFLSIAKRDPLHPKYEIGSLADILLRLKPLIEAEAFEHHNQLHYCITEIPAIRLNEKEIRQLLLNLVRNGLDAMPAGGTLTVQTSCQNNHVVLAVIDQGSGIDPAVSHKIGTPFFTTKDNGTGLGLAVCYGIAHRHNAAIHIDTSSDGTTFTIHFPIALTGS